MRLYELREIKLPSTLQRIYDAAFFNCHQMTLEDGNLPAGLEHIGPYAFSTCSSIEHIVVRDGNTVHIGEQAFAYCSSLKTIRLAEGLVIISRGMFCHCISLLDVSIPQSVTKIEMWAFYGCSSLPFVKLPEALCAIDEVAFSYSGIKHLTIPSKVDTIQERAFADCCKLETVAILSRLRSLGENLFHGCTNLSDIVVPPTIDQVELLPFQDCQLLVSVDLSQCHLTRITYLAFYQCESLKSVLLPPTNLKRIEGFTFALCCSLTHLWIPPTVKYIDAAAFKGCTKLLSLELPEGLFHFHFAPKESTFIIGELLKTRFGCQDTAPSPCIFDCASLVNLHIPENVPQDTDRIFGSGSIGCRTLETASDGYWDLSDKLRHRFDYLPLHRICYFQSYYTLEENRARIFQVLQSNPAATSAFDDFGMSVFHILALSQTPNPELFQELALYSTNIGGILTEDMFGSTPLDYLELNPSPQAAIVNTILLSSMTS